MHAIFFGLKRAWHGTLRTTRHALAAVGLTAARFDLLYAASMATPGRPPTQRQLRLELGVNRTTVSRMLRSLEELGLVTRDRAYADRRTRIVNLTAAGLSRVRVITKLLMGSGAVQLAVDCAVAGGSWCDEPARLEASHILQMTLSDIRHAFRDSATLHYPWHPEDF